MKINVEIDCTPEEARAFFGLPDVAPMQERLMKEVEERTLTAMRAITKRMCSSVPMIAGKAPSDRPAPGAARRSCVII